MMFFVNFITFFAYQYPAFTTDCLRTLKRHHKIARGNVLTQEGKDQIFESDVHCRNMRILLKTESFPK